MSAMKHLCLLLAIFCSWLSAGEKLTIADQGKSPYRIVLPDHAAPVLHTAARELSEHLAKITGASFPVITETAYQGGPTFFIGPVRAAKGVFSDPAFSQAKPDTIAISFRGECVYLNGSPASGPLYAVYTFLEDYCGVRWWSLGETDIPRNPNLTVGKRDYLYSPVLISREAFYRNARPCVQAARTKSNGNFTLLTPAYGDHRYIIGKVHTFSQFLPPSKYYAKHPEWYSLLNGKRSSHPQDNQLCLTNEEMTREFIRVCLEHIAKRPTAWAISVSQNDSHGDCICQCPKCRELRRKLGGKTDAELWFVNRVAAAIEQKYPKIFVDTIAYHYTTEPPKTVRPRKNVIIRFCPINANYAQSIEKGADNAEIRKYLEGWSAVAPRLFIWNYVCNFKNYIFPHPNYRHLADDIRYFVHNGAIGIFEQGDSGCNIGDFVRPRAWILQKQLWNPELDEKAVAREFFNGYYGPAGPYLLDYLNFLCDLVETRGTRLPCIYDTPDFFLSHEDILPARELYAKAENAVRGNRKFARRVRRERLGLDLAYLNSITTNLHRKRILGEPFQVDKAEALRLAKEFIRLADYWKAGQFRELVPFGDYARVIRHRLKSALEPENWKVSPEIRALPKTDWDYLPPSFAIHVRSGIWCHYIPDPLAPCGRALRIPNTHNRWAFQGQLPEFYAKAHKKWRFLVELRCDASAASGDALSFGLYDELAKTDIYTRTVKVSELKPGKYTVIETPPVALGEKQMFWCAAVRRPQTEVANVYISAITMIAAD